ncbi:MAG TPA: glucose 1-dehydrogenase [Dehalococcoidales bacterium]|nr:glucose 1-dehydrogenase [Dehalococcoidales bacterium]
MELGLQGKVAVVTGCGSQIGFGKAIALALAREGCDIVANDIDLEGAQKTAAEVEALGQKAVALKVDVTRWEDVTAMTRAALDRFGKIDILVNNAGSCTPPKPFLKMTEDEWNRDIAVNLNGTMLCTKAILPHMNERKSGKMVNITSGAGIHGGMYTYGYAAAKAGVIAFSKGVAKEAARNNININLVSPGIANTGFARQAPPGLLENAVKSIPLGRLTDVKDIANAVVFLASDAASDIIGQILVVTGSVEP